jgi:hypothetical protein
VLLILWILFLLVRFLTSPVSCPDLFNYPDQSCQVVFTNTSRLSRYNLNNSASYLSSYLNQSCQAILTSPVRLSWPVLSRCFDHSCHVFLIRFVKLQFQVISKYPVQPCQAVMNTTVLSIYPDQSWQAILITPVMIIHPGCRAYLISPVWLDQSW